MNTVKFSPYFTELKCFRRYSTTNMILPEKGLKSRKKGPNTEIRPKMLKRRLNTGITTKKMNTVKFNPYFTEMN